MSSFRKYLYALIGGLLGNFIGAWFCAIYIRPYNTEVSGVFSMLVIVGGLLLIGAYTGYNLGNDISSR